MRIALCDDEAQENERLESMIRRYAFDKNYDIECEAFTDGRALLERDRFDLYFLDFQMDGMDGIEVAQALKEKYSNAVTVCFLTNYETAAAESINRQIHADGFLKKPLDPVLLGEKLDRFYGMSFFNRFELRQGKRFRTVYAQDILYAEASGKQILLHMIDRVETYNYLIGELEKMLPRTLFYRIQRSYLINLQHVESYDAKSVTLKNGETLPLKDRNFQSAYRNFIFLINR
ncbi:MAG: response regulator transcription factor [Clostridia bacterium]|nr:response regulator transcription factor [Clostridia bacterium]